MEIIRRPYTVAELVDLGVAYMRATGISRTRLSILTAGHNRLFERLLEGFDCRTQAAEKASDWFDQNWPSGVPWPKTVARRRVRQAA
jgi:hypothetical protein